MSQPARDDSQGSQRISSGFTQGSSHHRGPQPTAILQRPISFSRTLVDPAPTHAQESSQVMKDYGYMQGGPHGHYHISPMQPVVPHGGFQHKNPRNPRRLVIPYHPESFASALCCNSTHVQESFSGSSTRELETNHSLYVPNEIIREIVEYFNIVPYIEHEFGAAHLEDTVAGIRSCLRNMCLVSWRFRDIALPVLERAVFVAGSREQTFQTVKKFLHFPERAERVKAVSLHDAADHDDATHGTLLGQYPELIHHAPDLTRHKSYTAHGGFFWYGMLKRGDYTAEVPWMLLYMTNLEILQLRMSKNIRWGFEGIGIFMDMVLHHPQRLLPNLRTINICFPVSANNEERIDNNILQVHDHRRGGRTKALYRSLLRVLRVPTVREFRFTRLEVRPEDLTYEFTRPENPNKGLNIDILDLDNSHVCQPFLHWMMWSIKSLKSFRYSWFVYFREGNLDELVRKLIANIKIQKDSLETLQMDFESSKYFTCPWEFVQPAGSFKEWHKLKHLAVSAVLLVGRHNHVVSSSRGSARERQGGLDFGAGFFPPIPEPIDFNKLWYSEPNIFPPCLETLDILFRGDSEQVVNRVLDWLITFIPNIRSYTPSLKILNISQIVHFHDWNARPNTLFDELHTVLKIHDPNGELVKLPPQRQFETESEKEVSLLANTD